MLAYIEPHPSLELDESQAALYRGALSVMVLGVGAYASFAPVFALFGLPQMTAVNAVIVLWLATGVVRIARHGQVALGVAFGTSAVVVHGVLATTLIGFEAGFAYQVLLGMLVQSMTAPLPARVRGLSAALCGVVYAALALWAPEPGTLSESGIAVFRTMNVITVVVVMWVLGLSLSWGISQSRADRAAAQDAAERALSQTTAIVEHMADGLVAIDLSGHVTAVNGPLRALLALADPVSREDLPHALVEVAERALATGEIQEVELDLGDERIGAAVASAVPGVGAVVLLRDVTVEREIDRMKTNLTAVVSHELRTPLTSVLGFTRMIQSRFEDRILPHTDVSEKKTARAVAQVRENLDIILEEGRRLSALINDVLDIAKMESGQMTYATAEVAVADLVRRTMSASSALFEERPVRLVSEVDEALPPLTGDPDRLLQVLINLVSNAAKFTDEGEVRLRASHGNQGVCIEVIDSGVGIPEEECDKIFDRFHQVEAHVGRPKGTGLGLPICRHIVEAHGGTIAASSVIGEGTTLKVCLPAA
ncbi:MAG: HAMP domain-containing histidine kinase [Deltaproteobacteria bacterium]|nr:MAG: HAMP domain-containing histidine kinase [Deltaproteobacteria bacterium]